MDHAYAVEILKKKNARRRNLRLASSAFAVLALTAPALPFIHLLIDEYSVRVSGYLAVFSSIRVSETALIGFPAGLRVSLILALLSVAIGMLAVLVKKPLLASGMFFASFILGIALTGFLSSLRSDLLASGSSAAAGSMQFGWMLFLLFAAAASVFSLAISGVEKSAETVFKMTAFISVGAVAVITV